MSPEFRNFGISGALEIFHKEHPHICLLDAHLGLSKIDGIDVLEEVKKTDKNVECIMITRITDQETVDRAKKLGVKYYLLKPLAMEDWLNKVHEIADKLGEENVNLT